MPFRHDMVFGQAIGDLRELCPLRVMRSALLVVLFVIYLFLGSVVAGLLGSIVGLGGGVIVIPILTILFNVDIHYAVGASIISVIATSSGAAAAYVKDKMTNLRIGMFLELATTSGAIVGAVVAVYLSSEVLEALFGIILLLSLIPLVRKIGEEIPPRQELVGIAKILALTGEYTERVEKL
jgi:uncharacterized protein